MPKAFWLIFQYNRALLNHLFSLTANTLIKLARKRGLTVGIFEALHAYGRQINFNCHIHLSIAAFSLNHKGKLKPFPFKFDLLMRQWRYGVINLLRTYYPVLILPPEVEEEGNSPQFWTAFLDRNYNSHWNVNIAKNTTHKAHTTKYLGSYVKSHR